MVQHKAEKKKKKITCCYLKYTFNQTDQKEQKDKRQRQQQKTTSQLTPAPFTQPI